MVRDLGFVLRIWRTTEMFSARKEVTCYQDSQGIVLRRMKSRRKLMVQSGVVWALTGCKWHIWVAEGRKKIFCFGRLQNVMAEGVEEVKPEKFEASKSEIIHSKGRVN